MYWVAPTAPLVSGGAQLQGLEGVLLVSPTPLKFRPLVVATCGPVVVCNAPGVCGEAPPGPEGRSRRGLSPWMVGSRCGGFMLRSGCETSCCTAAETSAPLPLALAACAAG